MSYAMWRLIGFVYLPIFIQLGKSEEVTIGLMKDESYIAYVVTGTGLLWKKDSNGSDVTCGTGAYGDFLLIPDRVDLRGHTLADVIYVDVEAEFSLCNNASGVDQPCYTNYFEVYVYGGSATLRFPTNKLEIKRYFLRNFSPVSNITNTTFEGRNERPRQTFTFFRNGSNSMRFGIRSRGACGKIYNMKLYYYFCEDTFINSVNFANTSSPVSGFREVNGNCSMNSSPSNVSGDLTGHCYNNGSWRINSTTKCSCIEGHQPSREHGCSPCPARHFKQGISNLKCQLCPLNSNTSENRSSCQCYQGYYSHFEDSQKPSSCYAPLMMNQKPETQSIGGGNVNVTWSRPDTSGNLNESVLYDVECYICEQNASLPNRKCENERFKPNILNNSTQMFVVVYNLQPDCCYMFRVYPKNSLNNMIAKAKWNYVEVRYDAPPSKGTQQPETSKSERTLYYVIGAMVLLLLILTTCLVIFLLKRRKRNKKEPAVALSNLALTEVTNHRDYVDPTNYDSPEEAVYEFTTELDPALVFLEMLIGGGEFGDVYKGVLTKPDGSKVPVASKTLKHDATPKSEKDFLLEASIMGQFDNPNVIRLEGVVTKSTPRMIVLEFMSNGSLDNFLKANGDLTSLQLIGMARGVSAGMKYLAGKKFVHRDLAARNILVNDTMLCKISDFGLSRVLENTDSSRGEYATTGGKIPVRWTALEAIRYRKFSSASDVWSYGILLWEIMSFAERPYWDWDNFKVLEELDEGYRLTAPQNCPKGVHDLMLRCWQLNRTNRPTFAEITTIMDKWIRSPETMDENLDLTFCLENWLESIKMGSYLSYFNAAGHKSISDIVNLKDEDLKDMGITLIGHRNKIRKGIISLLVEKTGLESLNV